MSRTNTAAYESIKTSQIVFQNPDRTFPEVGAVLAVDSQRGATTWTRNIDVDSVALSGPSSVGTLTYDNQLLVNGFPVGGGGGADVSGGSNIRVDLSGGVQRVSLAVREDIDMCSNSIINCKTIELPRIPNTSSAKITFGSLMDNKYGIVSYEDLINTLLITSDKNVEVRASAGLLSVGAAGISGETYLGAPITGVVKTGYSTKVSSMELNAANTLKVGATDISGTPPTLSLVDNTGSGSIRYVNPNIQTSTSVQVYTPNPEIVLQDSTTNRAAAVSYAGGSETLNMSAKNVSMISNTMGSVSIDSYGKTTSITNARISDSIYSTGGIPLSAAILTPNNTFAVGSVDISSNPVIVLQGGKDPVLANKKVARVELFDASGELRISADHYTLNAVPSGSYPNVLGYDVSSGEIKYQPVAGGSDLSGGYNISVSGEAINMNITQPVFMNDNPIVNASYIDLSAGGFSGKLYYSNPSIISNKHLTIREIPNPYLRLEGSVHFGSLSYNDSLEETTMYGKNINIYSDYGSYASSGVGLTMSSQTDQRIWMNVVNSGVIESSLYLTNNNELIIGDLEVPTNPVLIFQGGKAAQSNLDTRAKIEYFDASGVEQLRLTSNNYALNAVPAAGVSLPNVIGYDTSSGEIKVQSAGIPPASVFTYDASGSISSPSTSSPLGTFTPSTSGVYSITFSIGLSNSASTAIQITNNAFEAFRLSITPGFTYPIVRVSGIQNRANSASPTTDIYGTTIMEQLSAGTTYTIQASHETTSIGGSTSTWASCIPRVRIVKLC